MTQQNGNKNVHFTLSLPSSTTTSRSSSPSGYLEPSSKRNNGKRTTLKDSKTTPGGLPMDVYEATLPWWRASIRRILVDTVRKESEIVARMQEKIRAPWLDAYFVYTSSLGTHTFFMTALPALFFFGYDELGRGLLVVLAAGVYCSSFLKDLFCSPRPFSPPVTRLTMGSHHLEYGFPSTHSTNSVSIALFLFSYIYDLTYPPLSTTPSISPTAFTFLSFLLGTYIISIVFGRLYTAMHSFTDCIVGVILGTLIWWSYTSWSGIPITFCLPGFQSSTSPYTIYLGRGLGLDAILWNWTITSGYQVPLTFIPICLLLVNQHPQPVDDCPCFEDAIAFASVVLGNVVGKWVMVYSGLRGIVFGDDGGAVVLMPGSGWVFDQVGKVWVVVGVREWSDVVVWWSVAIVKMTLGILIIFAWRLLAKSTLHLILPPIFRFLSKSFQLPNRRFYTPATEYKSVPSEFAVGPQGGIGVLHPIPSVIDLPSQVDVDVGYNGSGKLRGRMRNVSGGGVNGVGNEKGDSDAKNGMKDEQGEEGKDGGDLVKHYDADVLTKVIVYAGIAFLATEALPLMFDLVGLGVKSWVD